MKTEAFRSGFYTAIHFADASEIAQADPTRTRKLSEMPINGERKERIAYRTRHHLQQFPRIDRSVIFSMWVKSSEPFPATYGRRRRREGQRETWWQNCKVCER